MEQVEPHFTRHTKKQLNFLRLAGAGGQPTTSFAPFISLSLRFSLMQCYPNDIDEELDYSGSNICVIKSKESLEKIISESAKTNSIVVELASAYGVGATPTFFFLLGGTTIDTLVGAHKGQFEKKLEVLANF
ncbi:thioredoxin H-type isoform X3 [Carex littledalei]|uniref:Thioredoxin H-type isoform X3 n=1 Tax=Carex littledalei TaxID=544730 RepID=A0A833QL89_9POAL|nr:thioredoxin H-type isoform X3 [Carex littledalei]